MPPVWTMIFAGTLIQEFIVSNNFGARIHQFDRHPLILSCKTAISVEARFICWQGGNFIELKQLLRFLLKSWRLTEY